MPRTEDRKLIYERYEQVIIRNNLEERFDKLTDAIVYVRAQIMPCFPIQAGGDPHDSATKSYLRDIGAAAAVAMKKFGTYFRIEKAKLPAGEEGFKQALASQNTPCEKRVVVEARNYRFVMEAIDAERDYQDLTWPSVAPRPLNDWVVLLDAYIQDLIQAWAKREGDDEALHVMRKIAALTVHCFEDVGQY